ncbi:MAG: AzlD domain-containing protein [Deltaproteobacteria bacterium]|nr:AzlD domain-containing protein [Deltaproteobacteria bacterium]
MNIDKNILIMILGMGLVTYIPRCLPLLLLAKRKMPDWVTDWLSFVPIAIFCALVFPELFTTGSPAKLDFFNKKLLVSIPVFIFALKSKSLGLTVIFGMFLFWLIGGT